MTFKESIITCIQYKYAVFSGRASRSEFWFFCLFCFVARLALLMLGKVTGMGDILVGLFSLAVLVPSLAVGARRLHDIGWSGWWQLVMLTGVGIIMMIVLWCLEGKKDGNKYGLAVI